MEVLNYPGIPGMFIACIVCGSLRWRSPHIPCTWYKAVYGDNFCHNSRRTTLPSLIFLTVLYHQAWVRLLPWPGMTSCLRDLVTGRKARKRSSVKCFVSYSWRSCSFAFCWGSFCSCAGGGCRGWRVIRSFVIGIPLFPAFLFGALILGIAFAFANFKGTIMQVPRCPIKSSEPAVFFTGVFNLKLAAIAVSKSHTLSDGPHHDECFSSAHSNFIFLESHAAKNKLEGRNFLYM